LFLIERVANQLARARESGAGYGQLYAEDAPGWRQAQEALREMGDSGRARQVPVLLVLYPAFVPGTWTEESYPLRSIHDQVTRAAKDAGLEVLDLAGAFAREGGEWRRWWALPWDHHPSVAAHGVAAAAIAEQVKPMLRNAHE
jgi:lysophospholipase L1-like esterase